SAYRYQQAIEDGSKIIVGVNKFKTDAVAETDLMRIDESIRTMQSEKLKALKAKRDTEKATRCLQDIRQAVVDGTNLMPPVIDAVDNYCTLGEIADVLRDVYGEYKG
ncbi:MAG TPA: methylmalonyl-CoA mutase family protein, partial [Chitinophagales bacterium]|nr:methylmalonyl-CoA mutase family protein [Chitinophagales bacterium]